MSHSVAAVKFESDGLVLFGEYNGTVDVMISSLYTTTEERSAKWRSHEWKTCTCNQTPEPVEIATNYGDGFNWKGSACRACLCLVSGFDPDEDEPGCPEWVK